VDEPLGQPNDSSEQELKAFYERVRDRKAQIAYLRSHGAESMQSPTSTEHPTVSSPGSSTRSPDAPAFQSDIQNVSKNVNKQVAVVKAQNQKTADQLDRTADNLSKRIAGAEGQLKEFEDHLANMDRRSVEVIGIFSSFVALVLAFVNTANSTKPAGDAFMILVAEAAGLVLFATLLEAFFGGHSRRWTFYIAPALLPILTLAAVAWYLLMP
jgi:hypothetical protein